MKALKSYAVYDMKDSEVCVGVYETRKDVGLALGITANMVGSLITRETIHRKRYRIEVING